MSFFWQFLALTFDSGKTTSKFQVLAAGGSFICRNKSSIYIHVHCVSAQRRFFVDIEKSKKSQVKYTYVYQIWTSRDANLCVYKNEHITTCILYMHCFNHAFHTPKFLPAVAQKIQAPSEVWRRRIRRMY